MSRPVPLKAEGGDMALFMELVTSLRADKAPYHVLRGPSVVAAGLDGKSGDHGLMVRTFLNVPQAGESTVVVFPINPERWMKDGVIEQANLWMQRQGVNGDMTHTGNPLQGWIKDER